ncbi:hypothetical protein [Paenibacillus montanisoli]|uniref:Uncharacterized protein n=1 Tax=Paenibacillus montanisoli TaxID=2081970 RepID=A0A328U7I7_9BACL|nr:hypothetical protein [Paenibacillus montanisoli]RAP78490.1 hypothetical protein DL346_08735 [Paenibacillus montanisoli]
MKKKFVTAAMTLGVAAVLVAGNSVISANASSFDKAQQVEVTGKHQQPEIAQIKDAPVSLKVAVVTAEKAIQEKFKVSLSGFKISYDLGTRVDMEGTFYFITYSNSEMDELSDDEIIEAKRKVKAGKDHGYKSEIYAVFVNAETGEIVSVEKNPTAPKGAN